MEEPAEQVTTEDLRQGEAGSRVRRRLVQSTLFPQSMREKDCNADDCKEEEEEEGIKDEEDDDWCSDGKKRKRKSPKRKATYNSRVASQLRASKKIANGKEISNKKVDVGDSSVSVKSDFFLRISQRRQRKRQEEDQPCILSQEENDNSCLSPNCAADVRTPQHLKQQTGLVLVKQQMKKTATPKKKAINSGAKKSLFKGSTSESVLDDPTLQFCPTLRLEAKMTAEENSRLSAGRPIHPFFSSWKVNKRNQELTEMENACCSFEGREGSTTFNPIHVLEADQDDAMSLDWGNWMFSDGSFPNLSLGQGSDSVVFERSVKCMQFDDFPSICLPSTISTSQNRTSLDQCPDEHKEDKEIERVDFVEAFSLCGSSNAEWQFKFLQQCCFNQPENSLWTDKYQPRKASQICGNGESVKFLSGWLCLWHGKVSQTRKSSFEDKTLQNVEYSCSQSDADSENIDEETSLKNVLLVTGPVGSGKSAAIYACAEEQGFQVIEVNASDWRNGARVKQRFGEALESHWLQLKVDNTAHSEKQSPVKSFPGITKVTKGPRSGDVELIQLSDEEDSQQAYQSSCRLIGRENVDEIKTLILFEEVDATLSEDHGFLSTVQQLAQTAKRPIILTANKYNPVLPNNLDRLEVLFTMPPLKELIGLGHVVCAAENARVPAPLIDRLIKHCKGDIRKTIMHLQFWCQGRISHKGNWSKVMYSPFVFDLEAGHQILPKLISWSSPSRLSELVEEEITKSLMVTEECSNLVDIVVEEEMNDRKIKSSLRMHGTGSDCIETKKEAMLNLNYSFQVEDEILSWPQCSSEFSDTSGSPVAFARRNVRRRLDAVMSSDSEEDNLSHSAPFSGSALGDTNDGIQGVKSTSPSHCFSIERCCHPSKQLSLFDGYKVEQNCFNSVDTTSSPCLNSISSLADVSSVPESLIVPETEVINEIGLFPATVSYNPHVCTEDVDSMMNHQSPSLSLVECEKLCNPMHDFGMFGSYSDSNKMTLHGDVVGDSRVVDGEDVSRVYQRLDECSCCYTKTLEKPRSCWPINTVEETWQRLRNCRKDLQQHVTPEERDSSHALKLAFGMSNLISEADILLSDCESHVYDLLEPSVLPCEKSHSHRWYDDQLQMSSIFSQHGICFYAKQASALGSSWTSLDGVDLAWEMLSSSTNTMALGKLLTLDKKRMESVETRTPISWSSLRRKKDSSLCNVLQSVVSSRACLALQGDAFYEYFSSLSQISRLEASCFSECVRETKQRRVRIARNYLSSGPYSLSPEHISLLRQCNSYKKVSCQSGYSCIG